MSLLLSLGLLLAVSGPAPCPEGVPLATVGGVELRRAGTGVWFVAGLAVDADGAPRAYHPDNTGLDHLDNAGRPGRWWALVTDSGRPDGTPIVQGPDDPAPGYHVSATALVDARYPAADPRRYVDSGRVPYAVIPVGRDFRRATGVRLGDLAVALHLDSGRWAAAIVADLGPRAHVGEGSIALAAALGLPPSPRRGGAKDGVAWLLFPGTGSGRPLAAEATARLGAELLGAWGGAARLTRCARP